MMNSLLNTYCLVIRKFIFWCFFIGCLPTICFSKDDLKFKSGNRSIDSIWNRLNDPLSDTERVRTLNKYSLYISDINPSIGLSQIEIAIKLADSIKYNRYKGELYITKSICYNKLGSTTKAIETIILALKLPSLFQTDSLKAKAFNELGTAYSSLGNYKMAEVYYLKSLKISERSGLSGITSVYNNIGTIKSFLKKPKEAIYYYKSGLKLEEKFKKNQYKVAAFRLNLAVTYLSLDNIPMTEYYLALVQKAHIKNVNFNIALNSLIGNLYVKKNDFNRAEHYYHKGILLSEQSQIIDHLESIYDELSNMYVQQGNFENALKYRTKYYQIKDSIGGLSIKAKINELQVQYETEKKDNEIVVLNKDRTIMEASNKKQILLRNSAVLIAILVLVFCFILINNIRQKRKAYKIIHNQSEIIESKNLELESYNKELMKENISAKYEILKTKTNPHFLFNSLSTLSSLIIKDPLKAIDYIEQFSQLYRLVLTFGNDKLVSLSEELRLINNYLYLQKIRFGENLIIINSIDEKMIEQYSIPPFTMQMMIENAIKHNSISRLRKLTITIDIKDSTLTIRNNFQKKNTNVSSTKMGQKNILDRYALLTDKVPMFFEDEQEYRVSIPLLKVEMESKLTNSIQPI